MWVGPPLALLLAQQQEKAHISSSLFVRLSVFEHLELPEGRIRPGLRFRPLCSTIYVPWHTLSLLTLRAPHNVRANGSPVFEAQLVGDDGNSAGNGRSL